MTDLDQLSAAATQGVWEQSHRQSMGSDGYMTQVYPQDDPDNTICTLHWHSVKIQGGFKTDRKDNADFIVAIVNQHRSGDLVTRAELEAAVLAERERCAGGTYAHSDGGVTISEDQASNLLIGKAYIRGVEDNRKGDVATSAKDAIRRVWSEFEATP